MKKRLTTFLCIFSIALTYAIDTISVNPEVREVTLFLEGAQLSKMGSFYVNKGQQIIIFRGISPHIDAQSIQLKLSNDALLLNISSQTDYDFIKELDGDRKRWNDSIAILESLLMRNQLDLKIVSEKIAFLNESRQGISQSPDFTPANWQQADSFHEQRIAQLLTQYYELEQKRDTWDQEKSLLLLKLKSVGPGTNDIKYKITCTIDATQSHSIDYELRYFTKSASWTPSYDFRLDEIGKPIRGIFRGNVSQNTKEDWQNVKLTLSTSNPNTSNTIPVLSRYILDYHISPPSTVYNRKISNSIAGQVVDELGEPLIGVNVSVQGSTIGTITDVKGRFILSLPYEQGNIQFSYVGYSSKVFTSNQVPNLVRMESHEDMLQEVIVTGYGDKPSIIGSRSKETTYSIDGVRASIQDNMVTEGINSFTYTIEKPYTINSGQAPLLVEILAQAIETKLQYITIPRIEEAAFVEARISDMFDNKALDGEASLFFENNFLGRTIISTKTVEDTISLSFGRDRNVAVSRTLVKSNTSKKFLSTQRVVTKEFHIKLKNKKSSSIDLSIWDQIPVSQNDEIEVEIIDKTNGIYDPNSGFVEWIKTLGPGEELTIKLIYEVKYPKKKRLHIE